MLLNPSMIAGLAAMLLPLILYFTSRSNIRSTRWAAMMFLEESAHTRWVPRREWVLLFCRTITLAVLAVAFARPIESSLVAADRRGCTVILIDRSGSMSIEEAGRSRIDAAREAALTVLSHLPAGDEAAVLFMPEAQGPTFSDDLQRVAARISDTGTSTGRADVASALTNAQRLLRSRRTGRNNIVIIGDRQQSSWRDVNDAFLQSWRQGRTDINALTTAYIPIGGTESNNCAILSAEPAPLIEQDRPVIPLDVRIANYSISPRDQIHLEVFETTRLLTQQLLSVPANTVVTRRCLVPLPDAGSHLLTVRINSDSYNADNELNIAVYGNAQQVSRQPFNQNLQIGELFAVELANAAGNKAAIDGPSGNSELELSESPQGLQARFAATNRPGAYRLKYPTTHGASTIDFVVKPLRDESDLSSLSESALQNLSRSLPLKVETDPDSTQLAALLRPSKDEPWGVLLPLSLVFLCGEMLLSRSRSE